jgi:hypothetical protein
MANLSVAADGTVIAAAGNSPPVIVQDPIKRLSHRKDAERDKKPAAAAPMTPA